MVAFCKSALEDKGPEKVNICYPEGKRLYTENSDGQLTFDTKKSQAVPKEIRHRWCKESMLSRNRKYISIQEVPILFQAINFPVQDGFNLTAKVLLNMQFNTGCCSMLWKWL